MRHRKAGRKFGMDSSARKAMFRNMVTSLMVHGRIKTTQARAKELRGFAERMISVGKHAPTLASLEGLAGEELKQAKARQRHQQDLADEQAKQARAQAAAAAKMTRMQTEQAERQAISFSGRKSNRVVNPHQRFL